MHSRTDSTQCSQTLPEIAFEILCFDIFLFHNINILFVPYFRLLVFGTLVTLVGLFSFCFFFRLAHLALQNVNKDYVIFSNFRNFFAKSDQKPKTKNGMIKTAF